ncbi:MAG: acylneuraminate cytidylyltransferase family protein [Phycisphaerales bacterium]|nr:acylneuraminate cytidylyltransferase family protein [Phycisphaerales bacterium]
MGALAVIIGRAGSKGVPGKNMRPVAGRPCAAWTIEAALAEPGISRVLVSSDDPTLLALAASLGAEPVERPAALAGDAASVDDAVRHAVRSADGRGHSPVVILYANVPVRPAGLAGRALATLAAAGCDSVQSFAPVGKHHPWWTCVVGESDGRVRAFDGGALFHGVYRRQALPAAHVPDGGVIAVSRPALELRIPGAPEGPHRFLGVDRRGVLTGEGQVIDIDSEIDLLVADAVLRTRAAPPGRAVGGVPR